MKFYYANGIGDYGYFEEDNLVKAIYTAWNIEADLYLLVNGEKELSDLSKLIFAPYEDNELNSELLLEFGYKMIDGEKYREIIEIKTDKVIKYDWSEVKQLI